jgi:hypothetical protein
MADVTFSMTAGTRTRLNQIAVRNGYPNLKKMTRAYWLHEIEADKEREIREATPAVDMSDVDITDD